MPADVRRVLEELLGSPTAPGGRLRAQVVAHRVSPATQAKFADLPDALDPRLPQALAERGIRRLYTHQRAAYDHVTAKRNTVVVTPTASGKTLCYNLPVLDALLKDPGARALYLFPTKALSRDQSAELLELMQQAAPQLGTAVYDGDTPPAERRVVRDRAHVIMSNPDMLHTAILPHHARWMRLFENLRYVVIDELHHYRGVFGSHLANVLRRLRRVCRFHGSDPVFIAASATIANARSFAERLLERPVELIEENGAPLGERHFVLLNPPVTNPALGLRKSYLSTSRQVASTFMKRGVHTIVFCGARTTTEVMTKYMKDLFRDRVDRRPRVVGYRGGYLPRERRAIERGLRDGSILGVVSTNALELGIDIGALDASVIAGYPGTVASTRQQAGRAGRRQDASAAVLVLRSSPLDQYLADHPEFLLDASPESAQINPDNLQILVSHLKCAAFEVPIEDGEELTSTGEGREVQPELLKYLEEHGVLRHTGGRWHWAADAYPANDISLRSVTSTNFVVVDTTGNRNEVIAEVDYTWAFTTIYEGAIYMVQSEQYHVDKLDWDRRKAFVRKVESEYYTDAQHYVKVKVLQVLRENDPAAELEEAAPKTEYGEVEVVRKAVGYKKLKFYTHENLGWGDILLPEDTYHTQATWFTVPDAVIESLGVPTSDLVDALIGLANLTHDLASMLLMCDGRDLGVVMGDRTREWFLKPTAPGAIQPDPPDRFEPTVFLYDQYSGGIGLAEALFPLLPRLLDGARDRLAACACERGCPACVGPEQEVGPRAKAIAAQMLELMRSAPREPATA
ncbi:MAG: DEAD/DEAH box helicase [Planctomycetota bacterium]|nr:DEAD/DEAH box helicase [Planctomycetota bacterium]